MRTMNISRLVIQCLFIVNLCLYCTFSFHSTSGGPHQIYQQSTHSSIYSGSGSSKYYKDSYISSYTVLQSSKTDKINLDSLDWNLQKGPDSDHPHLASLGKVLDNKLNIPIEDLRSRISNKECTPSEELAEILSMVMQENSDQVHVVLENGADSADEIEQNVEEVYVTENELKKMWLRRSDTAMGKSMDTFSTEESLLLIADTEEDIMQDEDVNEYHTPQMIDQDEEIMEENEIYVTSEELERIWNQRSKIKFGMPAQEYNDLDALLLLDPEDADDLNEEGEEMIYVDNRRTRLQSDDPLFWEENFPQHPELASALKDAYEELEDKSFRRPAWKKERPILTPDIDTQSFMGDMMFGNTYMTQRIPANWNDQETEGMSEAYLSTDTMAWPGEEETDYNVKYDAWKKLHLPIGPDYDPETYERIDFLANMLKDDSDGDKKLQVTGNENEVDWSTFDFAAAEAEKNAPEPFDETDYFAPFSLETQNENTEEEDDDIAKAAEETVSVDNSAQIVTSQTSATKKKWTTPTTWLDNPEYKANVGIDVWGTYDDKDFADLDEDGNPIASDDDIYTALSMKYILDATDYYLSDHLLLNKRQEEIRAWNRILDAKLYDDESLLMEPVPAYLTPDIDRNITYTDNLIEMKGKTVLEADSGDPKVEYANDSFAYNETMQPINKIGSVRTQYDWQDLSNPDEFEIDQRVVDKIQPLLDFVNHAAVLQSTKNNVLIFGYYGNMRHLIGIRANMIHIGKQCFPEMVDLLLESPRPSDKFDI